MREAASNGACISRLKCPNEPALLRLITPLLLHARALWLELLTLDCAAPVGTEVVQAMRLIHGVLGVLHCMCP